MPTPLTPPIQTNILKDYQFKLEIDNFPHVTYHCQNVPVPGVSLDSPMISTPHRDMMIPGSKIIFDPLNVIFLVDDDLNNYREVYYWMLNITFQAQKMKTYKSDLSFHILNYDLTPKRVLKFVNAHPTSLGELTFDSASTEPNVHQGFVTFEYDYFIFDGDNPINTQDEDLKI